MTGRRIPGWARAKAQADDDARAAQADAKLAALLGLGAPRPCAVCGADVDEGDQVLRRDDDGILCPGCARRGHR